MQDIAIQISVWLTASELGLPPLSRKQIHQTIALLPRTAACEAVCRIISTIDWQEHKDSAAIESEFLTPELNERLDSFRKSKDDDYVLFHSGQLLVLLAKLIHSADATSSTTTLSADEKYRLGESALHISTLLSEQLTKEATGDPFAFPVTSRSELALEMASLLLLNSPPMQGFMSAYRAHRILIVNLPKCQLPNTIPIHSQFSSHFGVALQKAFSLAACLLHLRYPAGGKNPQLPCVNAANFMSMRGWSHIECAAAKKLLVKDLDDIKSELTFDPLTKPNKALSLFMRYPILQVKDSFWWAHGPFLADRLLRLFYDALEQAAPDETSKGHFSNAFGDAVELYISDLISLAKSTAFNPSTLTLNEIKTGRHDSKRPDFEIGENRVRQVLEVKSVNCNLHKLKSKNARKLLASLESEALSKEKGLGQLASYAVDRYTNKALNPPARIQSLLIFLERLPATIPGISNEARLLYERYFDEFSAEMSPDQIYGSRFHKLHRFILLLSIDEFEALVSQTTIGHDLTDLCDRFYNTLTSSYLPVSAHLNRVVKGSVQPTYEWLGDSFNELFDLYGSVFPSSSRH